jgi:hypothetical protein
MTTTTAAQSPRYIVQTAAAPMPSSCWGTYRRVAVLEVEPGVEHVSMISTRARGVRCVVRTWEAQNVGTTARCAYERAIASAELLADHLTARDHRRYHRHVLGYALRGD